VGGGFGPGGVLGGFTFNSDIFERNNTSDTATNFGPLYVNDPDTLNNLVIADTPEGLPDYDWFRWTMNSGGTITAIDSIMSGDTEMHLFVLQKGQLNELTNSTTPGQATRELQVQVAAGDVILVEVKGVNTSFGQKSQGVYKLQVGLS